MNINTIKQELAKKFEKMSYGDFKRFEHELLIMYRNKHSKTISIDDSDGVWIRNTESEED